MRPWRVRWFLVVLIACGHPPPPEKKAAPIDAASVLVDAGPLDQDLNRLAERSIVLYDDIAAVFAAAGEDCADAATKLDGIATKHADVIAANAKVLHDGRHVQLRIALRRFEERFQKSAQALVQSKTLAACWQTPAFARALDNLVGPRPAE